MNNKRADFWRTTYLRFIKPYIFLGGFTQRLLKKYTYRGCACALKTFTPTSHVGFEILEYSIKLKHILKKKKLGLLQVYNVYKNNFFT